MIVPSFSALTRLGLSHLRRLQLVAVRKDKGAEHASVLDCVHKEILQGSTY